MRSYKSCHICKEWATAFVSICLVVSSMGRRDERKQRSTRALRVCKKCLDKPAFTKRLRTRVAEAVRSIQTGVPMAKDQDF